jgi:hypothetical protein
MTKHVTEGDKNEEKEIKVAHLLVSNSCFISMFSV